MIKDNLIMTLILFLCVIAAIMAVKFKMILKCYQSGGLRSIAELIIKALKSESELLVFILCIAISCWIFMRHPHQYTVELTSGLKALGFKGLLKGLVFYIIAMCIYSWVEKKVTRFQADIKDLKNEKFNKCNLVVDVSLDMKKILAIFEDKSLLTKFNGLYRNPDLDINWYNTYFIVKDNLIYVEGKLTQYVGTSIEIPNDKAPDDPFKIVIGFRDSDLIISQGYGLEDRKIIATFPLAFCAYEYNYHPNYLKQVNYDDNYPEAGTKEESRDLKEDYDNLRKILFDWSWDSSVRKKRDKLELKFMSLKKELLEKNGFKEGDRTFREGDYYYNENSSIYIELKELDHGLNN